MTIYFTSYGVRAFVDALSSYACQPSDRLMKKEKLSVFTSFTGFVLDIIDNISRLII